MTRSRTEEAILWLEAAPEGEKRTQDQAALLFGITQPTIAGEIARRRARCAACGQTVKPGMVMRAANVGQTDEELRARLSHVVNTYAWHLADCPAYGGAVDAVCTCGFGEIERGARV